MALKYNEAAQKSGVYVVGACGWDSIPCDMGIQYAIDKFDGTLDWVETVVEFDTPNVTLSFFKRNSEVLILYHLLPAGNDRALRHVSNDDT